MVSAVLLCLLKLKLESSLNYFKLDYAVKHEVLSFVPNLSDV